MKGHVAFSVIARIFASVLLVWAALTYNPSSYYTFLRWIVFGAGTFSIYAALTARRTMWALCFGLIALLFNPLIPVWLNRATWVNIDMATGILFMVSIFFVSRTPKTSAVSRTDAFSGPTQPQTSVSQPSGSPDRRASASPASRVPADIETNHEFSVTLGPENTKNGAGANLMQPSGSAQEEPKLAKIADSVGAYQKRVAMFRQEHPRAHERWTSDEENVLIRLLGAGEKPKQISARLQRRPSAIRSRTKLLGNQGMLPDQQVPSSKQSPLESNSPPSADDSPTPTNHGQSSSSHHERLQRIREEYSHAYDRWSRDEEDQLMYLLSLGMKPRQIAQRLRRQPSAIRSRIRRIDEQGLLDELNADADMKVTPSPWSTKEAESAFLPLATSWMSKSTVCVAGIDLHSRKWIRLVRKDSHSLRKQEATQYSYGQVYAVELGGFQERPPKVDPRGLHVEDRILRGSPRLLGKYPSDQQLQLLHSICDGDLPRGLLEKRSLFVVEPIWFTCTRREDSKIIVAFGTEGTDTKALRRSHALREQDIRVSSGGCPCNCLPWMNRAGVAKQDIVSMEDVTRTAPTARVFFVLSLTGWASDLPEDKQGHYLILAGIHVLDEEKEWL